MFFKEKAKDYESENIFYSLAALDNVDNNDIYYNRFRTALDKKCRLIAFTGRYGIGKTSIINAIINKLGSDYRYIKISLGNYKHMADDSADGSEDLPESVNFDINEIETKILQQIIYTTNESELPMSRFKRIKYVSKVRKGILAFVSLLIMGLIFVYCNSFYDFLLGKMYDSINNIFNNALVSNIFKYSLLMGIFFIIWRFMIFITIKLNVLTFKYKNLEITISKDDGKSVFNKYLDEIVYFFKQTKTRILVIEDLDRYGNSSLEIFKKLKELNYLLNSNKTIKNYGGVTFIYALRDDLFKNNEDRVKFFDTIIPVVSKFSAQNSREYIMELYKEFKEKYKEITIDEKLLRIISYYINDRRLLLNIFMEFKTYIDVLKENQAINSTELFAVICYKNINPSDYEKRLSYKGDLYNIFSNKDKFINILNNELISKNKNINDEIDEMKKFQRLNLVDIKKAFILDVLKMNRTQTDINNIKVMLNDREYSYENFMNKDVDYQQMNNSKIRLKLWNSFLNINIELLEEFKEKIKCNGYDFNSKREEIEKNIALIELNESKSLEEILNDDALFDSIDDDKLKNLFKNKLLISLTKNGFIKENYEKNISFFKNGDLTSEDFKFLISIDTNDKLEFDYKINNVAEVAKQIDSKSFEKECILNNYICDYLINLTSKSTKRNNFFKQFISINEYKLKFLDNFLEYKESSFIKLLNAVKSSDLLIKVIQDNSVIRDKKRWVKLILENLIIDDNADVVIEFKNYIENNFEILNIIKINDTSIENILLIKPCLDDYSRINADMIEELYNFGVYDYNISFYKKLCELYDIDYDDVRKSFIDTIVNIDALKKFKDGIVKTIKFSDVYQGMGIYQSTSNAIVILLNDENIIEENKKIIIDKEENKIENLDEVVDCDLWDYIITSEKCVFNMKNLLVYYDNKKEVNDNVVSMINSMSNYNAVNNDIFKELEKEIMYTEGNSITKLDTIADNFDYSIQEIDSEDNVNDALLSLLVAKNKVELNKNTYDYLLNNEMKEELNLIVYNNINDYLEIIDDVEIDKDNIDYVLNSDVDLGVKLRLIDKIDINTIESTSAENVVNMIIDNNAVIDDKYTNALFNKISTSLKFRYFKILYNQDVNNIKYLEAINDKIRNGISTFTTIDKTEGVDEFLSFIKEKQIINDYKIFKNKYKVTYSKTAIR